MYTAEALKDFESGVKNSLFPFMASLGYDEFDHSTAGRVDAFSEYEFRKGDNRISVYLGLNRLDYNSGIQIRLYSLAKAGIDSGFITHSFPGSSKEQIDQSLDEIKRYLRQILFREG